VLDRDEVANVLARTAAFNDIIANTVSQYPELTLIDANAILNQLVNREISSINGIGAESSLVPPFGLFSLDGVHPNGRFHGFMANIFIEAINDAFGSNILPVNPNNYPGNDLPQ
jgi:hypothetical protein